LVEKHLVTLGFKQVDIAFAALLVCLFEDFATAAERHVDSALHEVERYLVRLVAALHVGVERCGSGVLQIACRDQSRGESALGSLGDDRLDDLAVGRHAQSAVVGLEARREGRARGCRVGHAVVRRVGFYEGDVMRSVERRGGVFAFDLQHRNVAKSHSVADHVDDVVDLGQFLRLLRLGALKRGEREQNE